MHRRGRLVHLGGERVDLGVGHAREVLGVARRLPQASHLGLLRLGLLLRRCRRRAPLAQASQSEAYSGTSLGFGLLLQMLLHAEIARRAKKHAQARRSI